MRTPLTVVSGCADLEGNAPWRPVPPHCATTFIPLGESTWRAGRWRGDSLSSRRRVREVESIARSDASRHFSRSLSCWLGAIVRLAPGAIFGRWLAGSPGGRRVAGAEGWLGGRAGPRRGIFDQSSAGDCSESRFRTGLVGHAAVAFSSAVGATLVQTLFAAGSWRRARARPCGR